MRDAQKRKNLILGAGLLGSRLASFLKGAEEDVVVLDRKAGYDLRQSENYADQFKWADRAWFVAWDVGVWKRETAPAYEAEILDSNLRLCRSVFRSLEAAGKPFLFVSSQAAIASEMTTLGATKRVGELWTRILNGYTARFWNIYGWEPVGEKSHLIPDLIWQGLRGGITLATNGEETRQFLYVQDCVEALVHQFNTGQKVADITSSDWTSVRNVAELIGKKLGVEVVLGSKPGKPSMAAPGIRLESWRPRFSLEDGLEETIKEAKAWRQKNP